MEKENWSKGKPGGCVITDTPEGLPENSGHSGTDANKYYGGALVCESVWRKKDVALISAAPKMLRALQSILNTIQNSDTYWIDSPEKGGFDRIEIEETIAQACTITNFNVLDENLYEHSKPKDRTLSRLIQISEMGMGMEMMGSYSFGYKDVMSGLYLEKVWSYSDEEWKDYIDWAKELISKKQK